MKNIITSVVIIIIIFSMFYVVSCEDNPTELEVEPGRRDFIWEEDTLDVPIHSFISYRDIVANTPDDIYLGNLDPVYGIMMVKNGQNPNSPALLLLRYGYLRMVVTSENLLLKETKCTQTKLEII